MRHHQYTFCYNVVRVVRGPTGSDVGSQKSGSSRLYHSTQLYITVTDPGLYKLGVG